MDGRKNSSNRSASSSSSPQLPLLLIPCALFRRDNDTRRVESSVVLAKEEPLVVRFFPFSSQRRRRRRSKQSRRRKGLQAPDHILRERPWSIIVFFVAVASAPAGELSRRNSTVSTGRIGSHGDITVADHVEIVLCPRVGSAELWREE